MARWADRHLRPPCLALVTQGQKVNIDRRIALFSKVYLAGKYGRDVGIHRLCSDFANSIAFERYGVSRGVRPGGRKVGFSKAGKGLTNR